MQVLGHHIYEYQKGLRHLVLHTMKSEDMEFAQRKLSHYNVDYIVVPVTDRKINIFFGRKECVDVVRTFCDKPLNELTAEQDFILGIMLGYDRLAQCSRFLSRKPLDSSLSVECRSLGLENYSDIGIA
ncbi:MAG: DUF2023 family protein [Rikenellaceae bacterium]